MDQRVVRHAKYALANFVRVDAPCERNANERVHKRVGLEGVCNSYFWVLRGRGIVYVYVCR